MTKAQLRKELLQANNLIVDLESTLETTKDMVSSHFASVARRNKVTKDEMKRLNNTIKMQKSIIADRNLCISNLKKQMQMYLGFEMERHENYKMQISNPEMHLQIMI